ncbi:MAG: hypothetical protein ACXQTI_08240 [Candidatus Nezhaarchaeales archaeon]
MTIVTCCICGTGYEGEDRLVYGCAACTLGRKDNNKTAGSKEGISPYVNNRLRQRLILEHSIPLGSSEKAVRRRAIGSKVVDTLWEIIYV